jgi:prepilin-type N-terminal cleavage/methylation domain-containing protein
MAGTRRDNLVRGVGRRGGVCSGRGVTLVELLVVISIVVLLAAIAIPALRPTLEGQRIREASRMINVYFGSARNRAIETGRTCGVILRRFEGQPECAMVLEQAEVPPPYAGDTLDATATVAIDTSDFWADGSPEVEAVLTDFTPGPDLVHVGDLIQFNHQGPFYEIMGPHASGSTVVNSNSLELWTDRSQGQMLPWPNAPGSSAPLPYEIIRQPEKSAVAPLQLPAGTVVDLQFSGTDNPAVIPQLGWAGTDATISGALEPVIVMFSPNGSVDRVIYYEPNASPPPDYVRRELHLTEPIFLLVGRRENVGVAAEQPNWQDLTNRWVTLSPETGLVTTAEVASEASLDASREFARQGQNMGGR